jgi:hypothetical protein
MIEQYIGINQSKYLLPACIDETPVWRYLIYSAQPEVFDDVTADPDVSSLPFTVSAVVIDGIEYLKRDRAGVRANPDSWTQDEGFLYVHHRNSYPAWLFFYHIYNSIIGWSTGKTRFFDGVKYSPGIDIKLKYQIEADNLEYVKVKLVGGNYNLSVQGEFDNITSFLGNDIATSYSLDGINRVPLNTMFIESIAITLGTTSVKSADKREKLNIPIAGEVFTAGEYPKMKDTYYGKNKQEAFGFCRGIPAVCLDQRDIYVSGSTPKTFRTFRAASVITGITKVEVKMTQPASGQNNNGDVWVDQTGHAAYQGNGTFTLPASKCLPLLPNGQPDYGNEPYEVRITGLFRTDGTHYGILSDLLSTAIGNTWQEQCNIPEMQMELSGTGTVGIFIEKETRIFDIIQILQASGVYGWQLHDWRGLLTVRRDDNARAAVGRKIRAIDIQNINEVGVSLGIDNYVTIVEVEYQRNYSEKSNNVLRDDSNRKNLFPIYRNDRTYTAESYLEHEADARKRAGYLLSHFAISRPQIEGIILFGEQWFDLRIYDIIGVYLEMELRQEKLPVMLMVLSNEIRRQDTAVYGADQVVEYVIDNSPSKGRKFGGNIYVKIMRIERDISSLTTTIDGIYIKNIEEAT